MSDSAGSYPPQYANPQPQSTTDVAREQAANVGQSVSGAGSHVAQTATDQARQVAAETARQARDLMGEATGQVRDQACVQQQRAAHQLHSVADELHEMAAKSGQSGLATEVAQQTADRLHGAASWLEGREPADLLASVRDFARRRPGVFLVGAAIAGLAAGRLTRGVTAAARSGDEPGQPQGARRELRSGGTPGLAEPAWTGGDPAYEPGSIPGSGLTDAGTPASGYQSTAFPSTGYQDRGYQDPAYRGGTGQGAGGATPAGAGLPAESIGYPEGSTYSEASADPRASAYPEDIAVPRVPDYVAGGGFPEDGTDPETRAYPGARGYPQGQLNPEDVESGTGEDEPRRP
jgi:hypothetical protein